jgi:hypothetical protein
MAGFEQMQGQFLLAGEMFVKRGVGVAALTGDVANARRREPMLAEERHRGTEDLPLGRGVVFVHIERKRRHVERRLAHAN